MRILFTRFPLESTYGGAEVQTLSLMKGLRGRGHEVAFLGSCPVLLKRTEELRMKNYALRIGDPPVTRWGAVSFLWRQMRMKRLLTSYFLLLTSRPDAILMLSLSEKLLLTDWAVQHGIEVFWIEHDRIGRWLRWSPWLRRLRQLSRIATTVVVSDLSKRLYEKLGWDPGKIVVIPNGIDMQRFQKTDSRFQEDSTRVRALSSPTTYNLTPNTSLRLGTIARLSQEKGVDLLIEAIKDLPSVYFTIVGTGQEEHRIKNLIKKYHLEQRATIQRATSNVGDFYRSLDIFVLPSRDHDPCPLAPIEAMACGVPVIMTDACGTAEYIEQGKEAIIVPAGSAKALREGILSLFDPPHRQRVGEAGKTTTLQKFSLERMVEQYEQLLTE